MEWIYLVNIKRIKPKCSFLKNNEEGQSLVELAITLPLLLLLILGIVQLGIIAYGHITVTSAAREGVRYLSVGQPDGAVLSKVKGIISENIFIDNNFVVFDPADKDDRVYGEEVSVSITAAVRIIVPILDRAVGETINVFSKASIRYQFPTGDTELSGI